MRSADLLVKYWDLTADRSILTKSKIGRMAAILDLTKILLEVHQGPIIGHGCAQYELKSIHSCLRMGHGQKKFNRRWRRGDWRRTTDKGQRTGTLSMTIAHRWAKNVPLTCLEPLISIIMCWYSLRIGDSLKYFVTWWIDNALIDPQINRLTPWPKHYKGY